MARVVHGLHRLGVSRILDFRIDDQPVLLRAERRVIRNQVAAREVVPIPIGYRYDVAGLARGAKDAAPAGECDPWTVLPRPSTRERPRPGAVRARGGGGVGVHRASGRIEAEGNDPPGIGTFRRSHAVRRFFGLRSGRTRTDSTPLGDFSLSRVPKNGGGDPLGELARRFDLSAVNPGVGWHHATTDAAVISGSRRLRRWSSRWPSPSSFFSSQLAHGGSARL